MCNKAQSGLKDDQSRELAVDDEDEVLVLLTASLQTGKETACRAAGDNLFTTARVGMEVIVVVDDDEGDVADVDDDVDDDVNAVDEDAT